MEEMRQGIARIQRATDVSCSTSIDRQRQASIDSRLHASIDSRLHASIDNRLPASFLVTETFKELSNNIEVINVNKKISNLGMFNLHWRNQNAEKVDIATEIGILNVDFWPSPSRT
ncbi:hypothetical protein YC2023_081754 [Brassica napus]